MKKILKTISKTKVCPWKYPYAVAVREALAKSEVEVPEIANVEGNTDWAENVDNSAKTLFEFVNDNDDDLILMRS